MAQDVTSALDAVYRSDWGRIVAALIRLFGDFNAAEEAAQEAFAAAAVTSGQKYFWRALITMLLLRSPGAA
jgi:predicted RNA polymerase sigma factor